MPPLLVGLDAGGSGTRAVLASADGMLLAFGLGGPSGHAGDAASLHRLRRALSTALEPISHYLKNASRPRTTTLRIHAGLRGLSVDARRTTALAELTRLFPDQPASVSNDALIAQWGGLGGQPGVALLAGTGSIALARSADGRSARGGGYGYLLGDEGSAFWLGRAALAASLLALDGRGPPTSLSERLPEAAQQSSVADMVGWLYAARSPVPPLAQLAPVVTRAATDGDGVALDLVQRAARDLAQIAASAARQLWPTAPPEPLLVARCGGVWAAGACLLEPFERELRALLPSARSIAPRLPPVGGALLLALHAQTKAAQTNAPPDPAVVDALARAFAQASPSPRSTTSPAPRRTRRRRP